MYNVYKTTCKVTEEYYIGQSKSLDLGKKYFGTSYLIKDLIKKYGKEEHTLEIIASYNTREEAIKREQEEIAKHICNKKCLNRCIKSIGHTSISTKEHQQRKNDWETEKNKNYPAQICAKKWKINVRSAQNYIDKHFKEDFNQFFDQPRKKEKYYNLSTQEKLQDLKDIKKRTGYKAALARRWSCTSATVFNFIRKADKLAQEIGFEL